MAKTFNLHKNFRFSVMVDVFNLFNYDYTLGYGSYNVYHWRLPCTYFDSRSIKSTDRIETGILVRSEKSPLLIERGVSISL